MGSWEMPARKLLAGETGWPAIVLGNVFESQNATPTNRTGNNHICFYSVTAGFAIEIPGQISFLRRSQMSEI